MSCSVRPVHYFLPLSFIFCAPVSNWTAPRMFQGLDVNLTCLSSHEPYSFLLLDNYCDRLVRRNDRWLTTNRSAPLSRASRRHACFPFLSCAAHFPVFFLCGGSMVTARQVFNFFLESRTGKDITASIFIIRPSPIQLIIKREVMLGLMKILRWWSFLTLTSSLHAHRLTGAGRNFFSFLSIGRLITVKLSEAIRSKRQELYATCARQSSLKHTGTVAQLTPF